MSALDQALAKSALPPKAALDAKHPSVVALVIVAEEMQKAMQGKNPEFGAFGVAGRAGLAFGHASRDHDVAQKEGARGWGLEASFTRRRSCLRRAAVPGLPRRSSRVFRASEARERQDIRRVILAAVLPVQRADAAVAHQRDRDDAARAGRGDAGQPPAEAGRANVTPLIGDPHVEFRPRRGG
jgi:hypothetical protein